MRKRNCWCRCPGHTIAEVVALEQPYSRLVGIEVVGRPAAAHFVASVAVAAFAVAVAEMAELEGNEVGVETHIACGSDSEILALAPRSVPSPSAWWWVPCLGPAAGGHQLEVDIAFRRCFLVSNEALRCS